MPTYVDKSRGKKSAKRINAEKELVKMDRKKASILIIITYL